jgi:hypothetical protein
MDESFTTETGETQPSDTETKGTIANSRMGYMINPLFIQKIMQFDYISPEIDSRHILYSGDSATKVLARVRFPYKLHSLD